MSSVWYPKFLEALLTQASNSNAQSGDVKAVLVDGADYTYSTSHEFLSDVPGGARVATSANLASKTFTAGVFDAADTVFTGASGDQSEIIIVYIDTGSAATSRLMVYIDTAGGLPVTPNSGDITVTWPNGAGKIAAL